MAGHRPIDGASILTIYSVTLLLVPPRLTVEALGGAGTPSRLVGLALLGWWVFDLMTNRERAQRTPLRAHFLVVLAAFLASYVAAMTRPIDAVEASSADLGMLVLLSMGGVLLVASEGLPDLERLNTLVRRIVFLGGVIATIGLIQFVTGRTFVDEISIPGLGAPQNPGIVTAREGFNRPPGTSLHAIEYGAVITMILPLAVHMAMSDRNRTFLRRAYPVVVIAFACVTSISRSALICALVGLVSLGVVWTPRVKLVALALAALFATTIFVVIPGILGSLAGLFTNIAADSSAQSRTDSYAFAWEFIERAPWFGRGFSTFLPIYRIFDNQYLTLMIEVGLVGVVAVLALQIRSLLCASTARRLSSDTQIGHLSQALFAAIAAGSVGMALFDGFSFPMAAGLLFLVMGLAGSMYRLIVIAGHTQQSEQAADRSSP